MDYFTKKSRTTMTATQRVFVGICKNLGFPSEQIAISLSVLNEKELKNTLEWISKKTDELNRLINRKELSEYLHDKMLAIIDKQQEDRISICSS